MKTNSAVQVKTTEKPTFTPISTGLLQRKCACGNSAGLTGECDTCQKEKLTLQRKSTVTQDDASEVPTIAHEALSLPRVPVIQAKLTIGASDDPLEREADQIAERVMAGSTRSNAGVGPPRIQRFTGQTNGQANLAAPASVDRVLSSPGSPLEPALQEDMEQSFRHDFSRVRVYTDAAAERSARDINANAYTVGNKIVFGAGQFSPGTHKGRHLIAHELTHVVQQLGADNTSSGHRHSMPSQESVSQSVSLQNIRYSGLPSTIIFKSDSDHFEEQHCEDVSKDSTATCTAIIDCIEELIEQLVQRFSDIKNKGGDRTTITGHQKRIKIVQEILKTLMGKALIACKQGEYDEELTQEAEKWANKPVQKEGRDEEGESVWDKLRKYLPESLVAGLIIIGAVTIAVALVACFSSGACEFALALAGVGLVLAAGITAALRSAGVKDQPSTTS